MWLTVAAVVVAYLVLSVLASWLFFRGSSAMSRHEEQRDALRRAARRHPSHEGDR